MSYIAEKLKHRIHIMQGYDEPNINGSFKRSYKKLLTLWSGKKQIGNYLMMIRSVNTEKYNSNSPVSTDEFVVRYDSVISKFYRTFTDGFDGTSFDSQKSQGMGKAFELGFDNGYKSLVDIYPIKTDYFVFLQSGNSDAYRGRLYKINRIIIDDNTKELVILQCSLMEEQGLGAIV